MEGHVPVESNTSLSSLALDGLPGLLMNSDAWNSSPFAPLMNVWSASFHDGSGAPANLQRAWARDAGRGAQPTGGERQPSREAAHM